MRLTAKSEYGLLALIDLALRGDSGPVSSREIAERQAIPIKFLEQLMVSLRKAGIVTARRGARGGFVLQRDPAMISVLEIVEALEGPLEPSPCSSKLDGECGRSDACAAASVWERAASALRGVLAETTVGDLADRQSTFDAAAR